MKNNKGFTLIELLVVIAIIGILSSVVLASLNSARNKGNDAKVKSQLSSLRNAAEVYYGNTGGYGPPAVHCGDGMFADEDSGMAAYTDLVNNYPRGTSMECNSSDTEYAVEATLNTSGKYWCVDSAGNSRPEDTALGTSTVCS